MGCECSKIKVCAVCHEPCETYVCVIRNLQPSVKMVCCLNCVKSELDTTNVNSKFKKSTLKLTVLETSVAPTKPPTNTFTKGVRDN